MKVYYTKNDGKFTIYLADSSTAKQISANFLYDSDRNIFYARVSKLPKIKGITFKEYKVSKPSDEGMGEIRELYASYHEMKETVKLMQSRIKEKKEELIEKLKTHGLCLNPALPEDKQLLASEHTRVHHQQFRKSTIIADPDHIIELSAKHPKLVKCLETEKYTFVNEEILEAMIPELPEDIVKDILVIDTGSRFAEINLKNPECGYCGGKVDHNTCKHCGLKQPKRMILKKANVANG